jgi:transposase-like protein
MQTTLKCPHCGKYAIIKAGHALKSGVGEVQQYRCKKCGRTTTKPIEVPKDDKGRFITTAQQQATIIVSDIP